MVLTGIVGKAVSMFICAAICIVNGIIVFRKRKRLPYEVWIPLLALCILGAVGLLAVAFSLSSIFAIEALY